MNIHNGQDQLSIEELRALVPQLQEITEQYKKKQRAQDVLLNISEIASSCDEIEQLFPKLHQQINTKGETPKEYSEIHTKNPPSN